MIIRIAGALARDTLESDQMMTWIHNMTELPETVYSVYSARNVELATGFEYLKYTTCYEPS